jgi:hypothetical protein
VTGVGVAPSGQTPAAAPLAIVTAYQIRLTPAGPMTPNGLIATRCNKVFRVDYDC